MAIKISEEENGEVYFIRHLQKKFRKMRMKCLIRGTILPQLFIKSGTTEPEMLYL
jgi:hypothetical protein